MGVAVKVATGIPPPAGEVWTTGWAPGDAGSATILATTGVAAAGVGVGAGVGAGATVRASESGVDADRAGDAGPGADAAGCAAGLMGTGQSPAPPIDGSARASGAGKTISRGAGVDGRCIAAPAGAAWTADSWTGSARSAVGDAESAVTVAGSASPESQRARTGAGASAVVVPAAEVAGGRSGPTAADEAPTDGRRGRTPTVGRTVDAERETVGAPVVGVARASGVGDAGVVGPKVEASRRCRATVSTGSGRAAIAAAGP
jgi:hypothetical protein